MAIVGWVLIVIGIFFELLAAAGAARKIAREFTTSADAGPFDWLVKLIEAMAKAPVWIACFAAGLVLIYVGAFMTGNPINIPIPSPSPSSGA